MPVVIQFSLEMLALYVIGAPLVFYFTFLCRVIGSLATNETSVDLLNSRPVQDACKAPNPPAYVIQAFIPEYGNETLSEDSYEHSRPDRAGWYKKDTVVFLGCIKEYIAVYNGTLTSTCMQPDKFMDAEWNGTFPQCVRPVCWWLGDVKDLEFRYNDQILHGIVNGFPEGAELIYLNWTCPTGYLPNKKPRLCGIDGKWNGSRPSCTEITTTTVSPTTVTTSTPLTTITLPTVAQNASDNSTDPAKGESTATNAMLIWAVSMTTICIALVVSLVLIIRCGKCFSKQAREHQQGYSYEHRPLNQAENMYGEIHPSTREDQGHILINQSTYELDNRHSNTYEDIETTEVSALPISGSAIYAMPVPKPRRTAPSTESIANNQQFDLQVSQDLLR